MDDSTPRWLVNGNASGEILVTSVGVSFCGGVNPQTGEIIDQHHPFRGETISGKILAFPFGIGSCAGSLGILESLYGDHGPAAIVFRHCDEILTLGVIVSDIIFKRSIPVLVLGQQRFDGLVVGSHATISSANGGEMMNVTIRKSVDKAVLHIPLNSSSRQVGPMHLTDEDEAMLSGARGQALQTAMRIIVAMGPVYGATSLINIAQSHIDATVYLGHSTLLFAKYFVDLGARVCVPTTLNSTSVDLRRWESQGVDKSLGDEASELAGQYASMGADPSYTCAPYLLSRPPKAGEHIAWGESNAVMYANSVIGAFTQKYPDMLDVCIALTGRAPLSGCHVPADRLPTVCVRLCQSLQHVQDPILYPLVGYHVGQLAGREIPLIIGFEGRNPKPSEYKALGAALGTSSAAPMFHLGGVTPEALAWNRNHLPPSVSRVVDVDSQDLIPTWRGLNTALEDSVDMVAFGNPHMTLDEFEQLSTLVKGRTPFPGVKIGITSSRHVQKEAEELGYLDSLRQFGVDLITDTCWCLIEQPIVPVACRNVMTNSAKYAHYGPGITFKRFHFAGVYECVKAACTGQHKAGSLPSWLASVAPVSIGEGA